MNKDSISKMITIHGVNGISLLNSENEALLSNIKDQQISEAFVFLSSVMPDLEALLAMGAVKQVMLKGAGQQNLSTFAHKKNTLCIQSDPLLSATLLGQQIRSAIG
ncbi:MAG: hypothetical protein KAG28_06150 [Cocleimonas sp.]|nr:hypothetical protein [Cocleimonas sp.]